MRCSRFRQAVSARLDGEDAGLPDDVIDAHLATCEACQAWAGAAEALSRALGDLPEVNSAPRADVVASLLEDRGRPRRARIGVAPWRVLLALVAIAQLGVAWPDLPLDEPHASAHLVHELSSWGLGLGVGFLFLAWRPSRAWGALPLLAVLVVGLVGTSAADLLSGHALLGRELLHALEVAGLACVWVLARRFPRRPVVLRVAWP